MSSFLSFLGKECFGEPPLRLAFRADSTGKRAACLLQMLFRGEGGDDFFEAWIATQWVPERQQFQVAVVEWARETDGDCKLLAGEIFITNPGSDHREVFDHADAVNCIFLHGKKLNCTAAFPQCFLFPSHAASIKPSTQSTGP